jgi:TPR repeat protein
MRIIAAISLAAFSAVASTSGSGTPLQTQNAPATDCDTYGASPLDPHRVTAGVGVLKLNPDLAIPACEEAVRRYPDSTRLAFQLGRAYKKKNDFRSALIQLRKAADQGYAGAQVEISLMYLNGLGLPQSDAEALKWVRKAADQGLAVAQESLGLFYSSGRGVPQNDAEAAKWYRKSAEQGSARSQLALGAAYGTGRGVPQNYVQAHMWLNVAASHYDASAEPIASPDWEPIKLRDRLASVMSPAQIAEAQRLALACVQNKYKECGVDGPQIARRGERAPSPSVAERGVISTGTGFFVSENGHIITNAHVVKDCRSVKSSLGGQISKLAVDEQSDLALYSASDAPKSFARIRGGRDAKAGEPVVAVGFPLSGILTSDPVVTTGIISALAGVRNDRRTIQITAPVQPGSSGGPLLGENGSVVGVVVGKLNAVKVAEAIGDIPQNVNFAVSLGTLQSFLNANDVPYVLDDHNATRSPADLAAEASRYTVLLECLR